RSAGPCATRSRTCGRSSAASDRAAPTARPRRPPANMSSHPFGAGLRVRDPKARLPHGPAPRRFFPSEATDGGNRLMPPKRPWPRSFQAAGDTWVYPGQAAEELGWTPQQLKAATEKGCLLTDRQKIRTHPGAAGSQVYDFVSRKQIDAIKARQEALAAAAPDP